MKGIDVSYIQGNIDWTKVKTDFAFIRIGYGRELNQKDEQFEANYQGAKNAGIPAGGYYYSYAEDTAGAMKEAKTCLAMLEGRQFSLPIAYDMEEEGQAVLPPETLYSIYRTFAGILESEGYACMLYTDLNWMKNIWDKTNAAKDGVKIWLAEYNSSMTYQGEAKIFIWQNSDDGRLEGIKGRVDTNVALEDLHALFAEKQGWIQGQGRWWYRHADGSYTKNNWEKINGIWYHFDAEGWMQTGWLEEKGAWYYLKQTGAMASNEILTVHSDVYGEERYVFGSEGHMLRTNERGALY